ncbi:hypothetical protein QQ008_28050 [Fulvivirgaceae bacterium BMA10]|uniref:DUF3299 domain-containing protein n=1 Tax=Splendidivirga corallicola TaxID=3051826 RepID=A0ABT8KWX5_9BACT|nr:hypothetical protein [Fulvivirgaceae bacterium BMA10]
MYRSIKSETWQKLFVITFKTIKDQYGETEKPVFSEEVKKMEGKQITVPGYIFPTEDMFAGSKKILFSALPVNNCFFCGTGGPESVMTINLKKSLVYTERKISLRGTLELNDENPDELIYILNDAVKVD